MESQRNPGGHFFRYFSRYFSTSVLASIFDRFWMPAGVFLEPKMHCLDLFFGIHCGFLLGRCWTSSAPEPQILHNFGLICYNSDVILVKFWNNLLVFILKTFQLIPLFHFVFFFCLWYSCSIILPSILHVFFQFKFSSPFLLMFARCFYNFRIDFWIGFSLIWGAVLA